MTRKESMGNMGWTEEDKAAYMQFAQDVRDIRDYARKSPIIWLDVHDRLQEALERLGAK